MKRKVSDDEMDTALRIAHLHGRGDAVLEIWKHAHDGSLTEADMSAWTKKVADWVMESAYTNERTDALSEPEPPISKRLRLSHTAMLISGFCDPARDRVADRDAHSVSDEWATLRQAMDRHGSRPAAEQIWKLIATGNATQYIREHWLDFVASEIFTIIDKYRSKDASGKQHNADKGSQRGYDILHATRLMGKKPEKDHLNIGSHAVDLVTLGVNESVHRSLKPGKTATKRIADKTLKAAKSVGLIEDDPTSENEEGFRRGVSDQVRLRRGTKS
jgi:hypothetical protein